MSELPEGWAEVRIGDLLSALLDFRGRTPKKLGMEWGGSIPALSAQNVRQGNIDLERTPHYGSNELYARWMNQGDAEKGDIVLTMEAPMGNVAQIPDERRYILSQRVILLKTMPCVDNAFLSHQLRTDKFRSHLLSNATGTTAAGISQARLVKVPVLIAPLPEQKRIAERLDSLLARVGVIRARLDKIPALLERFRQSVLAAATSGELTEEWRGSVLPNWELVALKDVASDFSYGSATKSAKEGKVPVLRMGNIQNGLLDWEDLVFTSDKTEIAKYKLSMGDVLFNRTNSPELVGKTAVFRCEREAVYAGYLIRVRCSEKLLPDFLSFCINGPIGLHWRWEVKTDGVSQSNINATKLAAFEFELPPIDEQREIVRRVEALFALADRVQGQYEAARARVNKLTSSLLAKAFRGELVPQDPNDEPASVLLERLQAGKASAPKPVKKSRKSSAPVRTAKKAS